MKDKSKVLKTYGICETNSRLCLSLKMNRLPIYMYCTTSSLIVQTSALQC